MSQPQLTLIQGGEFIVCEDVVYTIAPPSLTATAALPINTMRGTSVRLGDEIVPLPFIRSQERKAVSQRIRIDGPIATRIAASLQIEKVRPAVPHAAGANSSGHEDGLPAAPA